MATRTWRLKHGSFYTRAQMLDKRANNKANKHDGPMDVNQSGGELILGNGVINIQKMQTLEKLTADLVAGRMTEEEFSIARKAEREKWGPLQGDAATVVQPAEGLVDAKAVSASS